MVPSTLVKERPWTYKSSIMVGQYSTVETLRRLFAQEELPSCQTSKQNTMIFLISNHMKNTGYMICDSNPL